MRDRSREIPRLVTTRRPDLPKVALVGLLLVAAALVVWAVAIRSGDGGGEPAEGSDSAEEVARTSDPCGLWTTAELEAWLGGSPWERDDSWDGGADVSCGYREVDGPGLVSVTLAETPTAWQFATLHDRPDIAPVTGVGDEAWWWEDRSLPGGGLVLRMGGRAASITLAGQFDDRLAYAAAGRLPPAQGVDGEDDDGDVASAGDDGDEEPVPGLSDQELSVIVNARLTDLGSAVAERLERAPFEEPDPSDPEVSPGAEICDVVALDVLAVAISEPTDGASLSPLGENGCTFEAPSGVGVTFELVGSGVDDTALAIERETTTDGETVVWESEPVEGLGDGAIWVVDPVSGTVGELHVLYDTALVRISSTGPSPEGIRERAIAAAGAVGPDVAALAE